MDIKITFEGDEATIPTMAYANDILLMIASLTKYQHALEIIGRYCQMSNARFSKEKGKTLIPTTAEPDGKIEPRWYQNVPEPRHPIANDYLQLGCFLRLDGNIPHNSLATIIARMRTTSHLFSLKEKSLKYRINTTNSKILGMLWHPTKICPLPEGFDLKVIRTIAPFIFHKTRVPINFEQTCYPKELGGLGVLNLL